MCHIQSDHAKRKQTYPVCLSVCLSDYEGRRPFVKTNFINSHGVSLPFWGRLRRTGQRFCAFFDYTRKGPGMPAPISPPYPGAGWGLAKPASPAPSSARSLQGPSYGFPPSSIPSCRIARQILLILTLVPNSVFWRL